MTTAAVIIPAAGRGRRMRAGAPKQYLPLGEHPVLWHTLRRFQDSPRVHAIIVAIHADDAALFEALVEGGDFDKLRPPVTGGAERVDSVRAALAALSGDDDLILVHDAVRPWVSGDLIERVVRAAAAHGAVIPALPVTETVKVVAGDIVVETPDRSRLHLAQTPQGFRRHVLTQAFAQAPVGRVITDEAALVEGTGIAVHVINGEPSNVKITTPEDLHLSTGGPRIGLGYDVHAFASGRPLVLGGVRIEHDRGLAGHSDADVLTHAVIDALLGAARLGDIGQLFPDDDPEFAGISSLELLERVRLRLVEAGATIDNIDAVVMAQKPKLAPYAEAMSAALAAVLRIDCRQINLKATTTEKLGFVGRQEGIAAQAVALLRVA